ncbi:hypothetical protein SDC9_173854 [bioreactor metagenome]|uniref:Uncharacterized protein n=1 Tax=bioreactor metagenome TaxID=1076179 RepID=A0A645GJV7_9ZZZZ
MDELQVAVVRAVQQIAAWTKGWRSGIGIFSGLVACVLEQAPPACGLRGGAQGDLDVAVLDAGRGLGVEPEWRIVGPAHAVQEGAVLLHRVDGDTCPFGTTLCLAIHGGQRDGFVHRCLHDGNGRVNNPVPQVVQHGVFA